MCVNALPACMYVHHMLAWCLRKSEEAFKGPRTGVTNACEPWYGCWELSPGLQEQLMLLTADPSHQLPNSSF